MDKKKQCSTFICDIVCLAGMKVSGNELGGDMNVFSGREKYDLPPETNTSFPKFDGTQRWGWNWNSHWKEIWKPVETNTIQQFPKFDGVSLPTSSVFGHFPTLCEEKTPRNPSNSEFICMGELIYQETPLLSTYHWFEAHWRFRITVRGVAAAVSLFGDDLYCICFDHPNRETAMLSRVPPYQSKFPKSDLFTPKTFP